MWELWRLSKIQLNISNLMKTPILKTGPNVLLQSFVWVGFQKLFSTYYIVQLNFNLWWMLDWYAAEVNEKKTEQVSSSRKVRKLIWHKKPSTMLKVILGHGLFWKNNLYPSLQQ